MNSSFDEDQQNNISIWLIYCLVYLTVLTVFQTTPVLNKHIIGFIDIWIDRQTDRHTYTCWGWGFDGVAG